MADSIRIERLCKVYQARDGTEVEALREVSFTVGRGEFVSIVGQSGWGSPSAAQGDTYLISKLRS